ncbi:GMP/IMP nucleotidase [Trichlorobacter lovleyi]|uniref:GMP/IMP nucleotidase n=1 Tax=Trichlorobacter lovleyi TaxID=313985 RepID=UPI00223F4C64|nr:GMP/IMP nucleotidase [Trichlorobacter lovleyi]QOX79263.1 GMP/IMP nucleotidase [Trichlorobacter lovleyi]
MILDWYDVDTVLLDMDGTLLDRHFDDHFWLEHVPKRWAAKHKVPVKQAREQLHDLFRSQERTLNWTDLDYWSDRLGLDIPLLKLEVEHLIAVHPGVIEFLTFCRQQGKQLWLVTNAHSKTLDIKLKKTLIGHWFDGVVSAHQVGLPKEDGGFWAELQRFVSYNPARTMLGEDSETNLQTAADYGIKYLFYVSHYSSQCVPTVSNRFVTIDYFNRLLPPAGGLTAHVC